MGLENAKTLVSVLHVKTKTGTPTTMSLIVTVYRLDPATKKKLGAAIITHTTVTEATGFPFLEDKDAADAALARFTGLFRVVTALSFTGRASNGQNSATRAERAGEPAPFFPATGQSSPLTKWNSGRVEARPGLQGS